MNAYPHCPVLGYQLFNGGCLAPFAGDEISIDSNNDILVKVNEKEKTERNFCVVAQNEN